MAFKPREFVPCPEAERCIDCLYPCINCGAPIRHICHDCEICKSCVDEAVQKRERMPNPSEELALVCSPVHGD